ncbi:MAG: response regulator [Candidatus Methylacidiphilales bacterium]|nr:response regulator [Candidatus Methylacidiphilales bacterium]
MTHPIASAANRAARKSVLVVEDNALERFVLSEWLRHSSYRVVEAGTADEAIEVLASSLGIHAVVTDMQMPGEAQGLDLVRHIRKVYPHIYVIGVSANDFKLELELEMCPFFIKPYDLGEITSLLATSLKDSRPGDDIQEIA